LGRVSSFLSKVIFLEDFVANYKGRTFTAACDECGNTFTSTHQYKADNQAAACYEKHYPPQTRSFEEIMADLREANKE
jgi:hypothetical protein